MRAITALIFILTVLAAVPLQAAERFTDNGDGTVTDHERGLMWAIADNQGDISWTEAGRWAVYTFPFTISRYYDDWRLPDSEELASLMSESQWYKGYETDCGLRAFIMPPFEISCAWIWTGEEENITARLYNFERGMEFLDRKSKRRGIRALPVRSLD